MHNTPVWSRIAPPMIAAPMIAIGIALSGCMLASDSPAPGPAVMVVDGDPAMLPPGSLYRNPGNGRQEVIVTDIARTAVLIGDSQSEPSFGWPRQALAALGYKVYFCGRGGTGYVAAFGKTGNYIDALQRGDWKLPYGSPPLVLIEGGGNDASKGASDQQIVRNADRLINTVRERYPAARIAIVGTLARGAGDGGGRRTEVDTLLGTVARKQGLPFVSAGDWLTRYDLTRALTDRIHLNREGHDALGLVLTQRLRALGLPAAETAAGTGPSGHLPSP